LVLAGVGGKTIAEAKERLSVSEAEDWMEYVSRFGSLDIRMRLEHEFARILATLLNLFSTSKNVKPTDLMPHYEAPEQSIEEFVAALGGSLRPGLK
jgi:hypothetical protein